MKMVKVWIKIHQSAVSLRSLALPLIVSLLFASTNALAQGTLAIMVMGDSIHHGNGSATVSGGNGMRDTPRTKLVEFFSTPTGNLVNFIGPNTDKPKPGEFGHASRGGWEYGNFFKRSVPNDSGRAIIVQAENGIKLNNTPIAVADNFQFDAADLIGNPPAVVVDSNNKYMIATKSFVRQNYVTVGFFSSEQVSGWATYHPDFILCMIGINEATGVRNAGNPWISSIAVPKAKSEMDEIFDCINGGFGTNTQGPAPSNPYPGMNSNAQTLAPLKVLLSKILPTRDFAPTQTMNYNTEVADLNAGVISQYSSMSNVEIVEVPSALNVNTDLLDDIHLNQSGAEVVARNWIKHVMAYLVADQAAVRNNPQTAQYGVRLGDLDFNGTVDNQDFLTLSFNFGNNDAQDGFQRYMDGDINGNGVVDFADFNILAANFNG